MSNKKLEYSDKHLPTCNQKKNGKSGSFSDMRTLTTIETLQESPAFLKYIIIKFSQLV